MTGSKRSALILGPGNDMDRAIIRALSTDGTATVATSTLGNPYDLAQHGVEVPHWTSEEADIDENVSIRMLAFLRDQGRNPSSVIVHVELPDADRFPKSRTWKDWWTAHPTTTSYLLAGLRVAMAAVPPSGNCSVILVYQLAERSDDHAIYGWLEHTMKTLVTGMEERGVPDVRVNAVLSGRQVLFVDVAEVVRFLCSPAADRVSGAFIPVDDGAFLRAE